MPPLITGHASRLQLLFRQRRQAQTWLQTQTCSVAGQRLSTSPEHEGSADDSPCTSTQVRILRQPYISVTKGELHEAISHLGQQSLGSSAATNWVALRKVLATLEIVYRTEYQRAGEELQSSIRAMNSCVIVPPGASVQKGKHGEPDDAVFASPETAQQLERQFLQHFQALTEKCHFKRITPRDSAMADALNVDYLSQLFIQPSAESTDGTLVEGLVEPSMEPDMKTVAVLHRGWGTVEREGAVIGPKLDFLQQVAARGLIRYVQRLGTSFRSWAGRQSEKAAVALEAAVAVAKDQMSEVRQSLFAGHTAAGAPDPPNAAKLLSQGVAGETPGSAASVAPASDHSHADRRAHTWRLAHVMAPPHGEERLREFEERWPICELPGRSPLHINRVTVGDTLGGDTLVNMKKEGFTAMLTRPVKLVEPTFKEILVVSRPKPRMGRLTLLKKRLRHSWYTARLRRWEIIEGARKMSPSVLHSLLPDAVGPPEPIIESPFLQEPIKISLYKDVPVPIWRVCFPFRHVSFKPMDLLKMDLMALAGVLAIAAQLLYGNQRGVFQVVWISSISVQAMRVVLGYTRMYSHFEGYVNRKLHEKKIVSEASVAHMLSSAAATQQYKQTALLYALLAANMRGKTFRSEVPSHTITVNYAQLAVQAELLLETCGDKVSFQLEEAMAELTRLGIVKVLHVLLAHERERSITRMEVLAPEAALQELEAHWGRVLRDHVRVASATPSSNLWQYSFWDNVKQL